MQLSFLQRIFVALCFGYAATLFGQGQKQADETILAEMQQKIKALQQKIVETQDAGETAKLQGQINEVLEEALKRISPKARPMLEIGLKLMRPLSEEGVAYTEASSAFFESPQGKPSTVKTREDIAERIREVERLAGMNQKLLDRINAMESEAEKLIKKSGSSAAEQEAFMVGYRRSAGRNLGALRAIRTLDAKVLGLWVDWLHLMDTQWGHWRAQADETLKWDDEVAEQKTAAILQEMNVLAERQVAAQKSLVSTR